MKQHNTSFITRILEPSLSSEETTPVNIFTKSPVKQEREPNATWEPRTTALLCPTVINKTLLTP